MRLKENSRLPHLFIGNRGRNWQGHRVKMREIILDTETTGLDPQAGHRIVEIGCVEVFNCVPTGATYHQYINPLREMPEEAFQVHGLSTEYLKQFPPCEEILEAFLTFIGDSPLVIHNAAFDMKFLNAELSWAGRPPLHQHTVIDTLAMARQKFPGAPASLDALCRRFNIDNTAREKHGALLDSEILAEVYLELRGGKQTNLFVGGDRSKENLENGPDQGQEPESVAFPHRAFPASEEEVKRHAEWVHAHLKDSLWGNL